MPPGDRSIGQVARDLDLMETSVRHWVKQAEVDHRRGPENALTTEEKEELGGCFLKISRSSRRTRFGG